MKLLFFVVLLIFLAGCSMQDAAQVPAENPNPSGLTISGTRDLILTEQDLQQLGMASNGTECLEEEYQVSEYSPLMQYTVCYYKINGIEDTEVILELKKFTNFNDLNGTYQYDSSHLFGAKGFISENEYGDQSKFHVNSEDDYGAQYNEQGMYYYHLWITKDLYLIHITSSGRNAEAKSYISSMANNILSKFM